MIRTRLAPLALAVLAAPAFAADVSVDTAPQRIVGTPLAAQTWAFDETTTGQDIFWVSPTAVDPSAVAYDTQFDITTITVDVVALGIPLSGIDVTGDIPAELLASTANIAGPAPVGFVDLVIDAPGAPEPTAVAGTISAGIDATGFGFLDFTDVVLGVFDVDLGFPFGTVTADITAIRIAGTVTVSETQWTVLGGALAGADLIAPALAGSGELLGGDLATVTLSDALPLSTTALVIGLSELNATFKGGVMVPAVDIVLAGLPTDATGGLALSFVWPTGLPAGIPVFWQHWVSDAGGPVGFEASNAVSSTTP